MKKVTLAMGSVHDHWLSSNLHLQYLYDALSAEKKSGWQIDKWHSEVNGHPWLRRRIKYPIDLWHNLKGNLHLVDQSYADALNIYSGPSIVTVADIAFSRARGINPFRWLARERIISGLNKASALIAISNATASEIEEELHFSGNKIFVVPFAMDAIFSLPPDPVSQELRKIIGTDPYILHVGSLDARKGFSRLLDSLKLDPSLPRLVQVGGEPDPVIKEKIQRLELGERIFFLGKQPQRELHSLYGEAEALLFPSAYEGYGIPPVEARASGTRIITTPMPSVEEALGEQACLAKNASAAEWLSCIKDALSAPKPKRLSSEKLYQLSWQRVAKDILKIYAKVF